jgi:predicted metal-dependent hydrolase
VRRRFTHGVRSRAIFDFALLPGLATSSNFAGQIFWWLLSRRLAPAGCRRRACHKNPHPVRDPAGHSYHAKPIPVAAEASLSSNAFLWGLDLFNHGYFWEAHEAWEGLWQVADRDGPLRMLFKGLILLAAAGVKIRERKNAAAQRHARRAAARLRQLMKVPDRAFERALGMSPAALADCAEVATRIPADLQTTAPGQPQPMFNFILGANSRGSPSGSQKRNGHP